MDIHSIILFAETIVIAIAGGVSLMAVVYYFYTTYLPDITIEQKKMQAPIYKILGVLKYVLLFIIILYFLEYSIVDEYEVFFIEYTAKLLAVIVVILFTLGMKRFRLSKFYCGAIVASSWHFYLSHHVKSLLELGEVSLSGSMIYYSCLIIIYIFVYHIVKSVLTKSTN